MAGVTADFPIRVVREPQRRCVPISRDEPSLYAVLGKDRWCELSQYLGLTRRQGDVARLLADGLTYESIAVEAGISVNTVRMHLRGLFKKLDAHDRVSVVVRLIAADQVLQAKRGHTE